MATKCETKSAITRLAKEISPRSLHIFRLKCATIRFQLGLCPRPRWGSLQRSPDPLARPSASIFGPSGFRLRRLRRLVVPPSTTIPPNNGAARIHTGYDAFRFDTLSRLQFFRGHGLREWDTRS